MLRWAWPILVMLVQMTAQAQPAQPTLDPENPTTARSVDGVTSALVKAEQLARREGVVAAYRYLLTQETAYAGIPDFDFALGLAALDAGEAARAIFAFERVITQQPGHLRARAELARAYAATKEFDAAKKQLNDVASQELPPAVRDTVNRFLSAIDIQRQTSQESKDSWAANLEMTAGHDSNANLGSSNSTWIGAGGLTLYPSAQLLEQKSNYFTGSLNLSHSRRLNDRWSWSNGASISMLWNLSDGGGTITRNFGTFDARSGIAYRADSQEWSLTMLAQHLRQDNDASRNAIGINGQWQKELGKQRVATFLQSFKFSHPGAGSRDASRHLAGISLLSAVTENSVVVATAGVGKQQASVLPQFGFSISQMRLSAEHLLSNGLRLIASAGLEQRSYDGIDPLFGNQARRDTEKDLKLGLQYALNKQWTLTPTLALLQNDSSVQAYEYRRRQFFLFARFRF